MRRLRGKLTYANVVSTLCLFVLLGGGAYAATQLPKGSVGARQLKKSSVTTAKIKNGAVTGVKVKASTLGKVPEAALADRAKEADDAGSLGGSPAAAYAKASNEPVHLIGAPGEPEFKSECENLTDEAGFEHAGFYKDPFGVVHLVGAVTCGKAVPTFLIFTLPSGFAPAKNHEFAVSLLGPAGAGRVEVLSDGRVFSRTSSTFDLDGIGFPVG